MKFKLFFTFVLLLINFGLHAQTDLPIGESDLILQGYDHKVSGNDFTYNSTLPGINKSLIVRATDGKQEMIWETESVPDQITDYISFIWLAGFGCNAGNASMKLVMNKKYELDFQVNKLEKWLVKGPSGIELHYRHNRYDGVGDKYGFMFLRVPKLLLEAGKPVQIAVTGARENSRIWYMTFKAPLKNGLTFKAFPAVLRGSESLQTVALTVYHFGMPERGKIYTDGKRFKEVDLHFGHNYFSIKLPEVKKKSSVTFRLKTRKYEDEQVVTLKPVKKWQVDFVMHSHTDIGYTRPQTEILAEHLRYIDYALDYCDVTDHYPDDAKFRWTCEAAWAVDEYLKSRPKEQIERLKQRVKEKRIEITGMYFNFDELPDEQTLAASLAPIKRFQQHGLDVKLAMQNDVNGTGWCFNDYFNPLGIKYLDMGTHGHRALICFDIPTSFWWESPSGNRMLAFRAEHYMTGNTKMGIHTRNFSLFEEKLLYYLDELERKKYPYDIISIQHSGYLTDNSPPSTLSCDMIRLWNDKYEWPKLRQAIAREFFEEIEEKHGNELPVYKVAWPDWWTDGFGSAAREVAATRSAHSHIIANQGALAMASLLGSELPAGIEERIFETNKSILFYGEHTMGSSESVRDPYGTVTMEQREMKESFAWEANRRARMIGEEAMGLLQSFYTKEDVPSILVFNTLGWDRSGLVTVYIDHQILPENRNFRILDAEGREVPAQQLDHRSDGTEWGIWVEDVPAFGVRKLRIEVGNEYDSNPHSIDFAFPKTWENEWYSMKINAEKAAITNLWDKELNLELVDQDAKWKLGEFINELLDNRAQMESFKLDNYRRIGLDTIWYAGYEKGKVWNTIRFRGEQKTFFSPHGYTMEIRVYNVSKRIDFEYEIIKKPLITPEGIYLSFPFMLEDGKIFSEVPGGIMQAGVDQLPGSANDWNTLQFFTTVRNSQAQIIFGSQEVPLVQYGSINSGRYQAGAEPATNHIYSWPMNNYWTTNFNADQRGGHKWSYYLTSTRLTKNSTATQFGWGARIPFPVRVLPAGEDSKSDRLGSILKGFPENVLLVNAKPVTENSSVLIQLRELDGLPVTFQLQSNLHHELKMAKVDVVGNEIKGIQNVISMKPYETAFYKVSW